MARTITITLYGSPCYMAEQNTMQNDINTPGKGDSGHNMIRLQFNFAYNFPTFKSAKVSYFNVYVGAVAYRPSRRRPDLSFL